MRVLLQRVSAASVSVAGEVVGRSGPGLCLLVCAMPGDTLEIAERMATKVAGLRIFHDDNGKMNRSLLQTGGSALVVSQFTLAADTRSGTRPGFSRAAPPDLARGLCESFALKLEALGVEVGRGRFGAEMQVALVNEGPVTIWLDSED